MRIQRAVADLHPVHRPRTDLPLNLTAAECASLKNLYLKTDLGIIDCLGAIKAVGNYDEVSKHAVELERAALDAGLVEQHGADVAEVPPRKSDLRFHAALGGRRDDLGDGWRPRPRGKRGQDARCKDGGSFHGKKRKDFDWLLG